MSRLRPSSQRQTTLHLRMRRVGVKFGLASSSTLALSTSAWAGATDLIHLALGRKKHKWAGSGLHLNCKGYYNLVCVGLRSNFLIWPGAAHWYITSYQVLSTSAWAGATDRIQFVWARKKHKWAGSGRHPRDKRHYILVCVGLGSNLGWPAAAHWDTTSYVALSTSAWAGATDWTHLVLGRKKHKWAGSGHHLNCEGHYILVCVGLRSNLGWPAAEHWDTTSYVALSTFYIFLRRWYLLSHDILISTVLICLFRG
jgi:hypothetical protein